MKCSKCHEDFEEKDLDCSHDIPRYIGGTDLDGRHWLCKKHHKEYERLILVACLKYVGEELREGEEIGWMKDLSRQPEAMKKIFRGFANEIKLGYFTDGRG